MYSKTEADRLYDLKEDAKNKAHEAERNYYTYLKEMKENCNHNWELFGFDYKCSNCGKFDY